MFDTLIQHYPFKPYSFLTYYGVSEEKINGYYANEIKKLSHTGELVITHEGDALALYQNQPFDTDMLKVKTAKIEIAISTLESADKLAAALLHSFEKNAIEFVTIRVNAQDINLIHALESHGFNAVDAYIAMAQTLPQLNFSTTNDPFTIRMATEKDILPLQQRIARTFIYSRFFQDPAVDNNKAVKIHEKWIENSILQKVAARVLVAELNNQPVGFVSMDIDENSERVFGKKIGHIPLIGVSPQCRGKNVGKLLLKATVSKWFKSQKVDIVCIETQLTNIPAIRTYEQVGFRIVDSFQTLRWVK